MHAHGKEGGLLEFVVEDIVAVAVCPYIDHPVAAFEYGWDRPSG
jgi:hypothetical protein